MAAIGSVHGTESRRRLADHNDYHWYTLGASTNAAINGNVATFTITDGSLGDDDLTVNGIIVDQGGPGVPSGSSGGSVVAPIPLLSYEALLALLVLIGATGMLFARRMMR